VSTEWKTIDGTFNAKFAKPGVPYTKVKAYVWESLLNLKPYGINYSD